MLNVRLLVVKALQRARRVGLRRFAAEVPKRFLSLFHQPVSDFDQVNRTDTGGLVPLWRFQIAYPSARFGAGYKSPTETRIREALESVPRHTTLVDLGSGKGRALIVAARMGFREVIGVEFAAELADIARRNLAITGAKAEVVEADASEYALPDGPLCIYLYSPFSLEIMEKVVAKLDHRFSETWVVYLNPASEPGCAELFDSIMDRAVERPGLVVWRTRRKSCGTP